MTHPRPTSQVLVHFCLDGEGVLMRRDREVLVFLGVCEICDGKGRNCQICGWEHAECSTPRRGPICEDCELLLQ